MSDTSRFCRDDRRRDAVRAARNLNGLDYLELVETDDNSENVALALYFLGKAPPDLAVDNIRLSGGRRIRADQIVVTRVGTCRDTDGERDDVVRVYLDRWGDFSTYTLRLVQTDEEGRPTDTTLQGFDPRYDRLEFSFQTPTCSSDLDCKTEPDCPPAEHPPVALNYLAKDYAGFRQLILDRLALLMPGWQERHVPDLGIALVELLAYVGDQLSYYQDAVATEAYLETARERISVRRHVRLVDYPMHDGCNARAWVTVKVEEDLPDGPGGTPLDAGDVFFITQPPDLPPGETPLSEDDLRRLPGDSYVVFEPVVMRDPETFQPIDVLGLESVALSLREGRTPEARYLRERLSDETQRRLAAYSGPDQDEEQLIAVLVQELNALLSIRGLYDARHFVGVRYELLMLLRLPLRGPALRRANRKLIAQAIPGALREGGKLYFFKAHNEIHFYTWGDAECCLPRGATTATLCDAWVPDKANQDGRQRLVRALRHLRPGDVLIFEEVIGPRTGNPADADPAHRHAVRLTSVRPGADALYTTSRQLEDPVEVPTPIVEIAWDPADALPFPLCLSTIGPAPECALLGNISVARGNVLLVDHGRTIRREELGHVPISETAVACSGEGRLGETTLLAGPFRPFLQLAPLTFSRPAEPDSPASTSLRQDPRRALPQVTLYSPVDPPGRGDRVLVDPDVAKRVQVAADPDFPDQPGFVQEWAPRRDLLASGATEAHFAVEVDDSGRAYLRFGDGELGMAPEAGAHFSASYRVGNGPAGNVGADRIVRMVLRNRSLSGVTVTPRNPLPARGGQAPEPLGEVRLLAPDFLRIDMQRAVTADDYAQLVLRHFAAQVQRAAAALRWTGSRYEVQIAVDPLGSVERDQALLDRIRAALEPYRRLGHDLRVELAHYVPLDLALTVYVKPNFLRGHVKAALLDLFSNQALSGGRRGFFHPDRLSFGDNIYLSRIVAEAMTVPGIDNVIVKRLERRFAGPNDEIENGVLPLGPFEIARLDNDPSFPEQGALQLELEGGR